MKFNLNLLFKPENLAIGLLLFGTGFVAGKFLLNKIQITSSAVAPSQSIAAAVPLTATDPPFMRDFSHSETPLSYAMIQDDTEIISDMPPDDSLLDDYDNSVVENYY